MIQGGDAFGILVELLPGGKEQRKCLRPVPQKQPHLVDRADQSFRKIVREP